MSKLQTCCEFYNVDCNQRRNCPADTAIRFAAETEGVMPMATGCSVKALPDPAKPTPAIEPQQDDNVMPVTGMELFLIFAIVSICTAAVAGVIWQVSPF